MAEIATGSGAPDDLPGRAGSPGQPYGAPSYGAYEAPGPYVPPPAPADQISSGPAEPGPGNRRAAAAKGAGLLVAGLLVGVLGVTALQHDDTPATSNAASTTAFGPGGAQGGPGTQGGTGGQLPGGFGGSGGRGGVDGETRTVGTVTAVTGSSVTVRGSDGTTATYQVNGDTEIARDGAQIALSDVKAGETVLVHVLPGDVAERVLVGTLRRGAGPGTPPGGSTSGSAPGATTTGDTV